MARKVQDLEEQVKDQNDQMLSKVGPPWDTARVQSEGWGSPGWCDQ